jgi:hypothetical protein
VGSVVALSTPAPAESPVGTQVSGKEYTMTTAQMNYFLDRIHYGQK